MKLFAYLLSTITLFAFFIFLYMNRQHEFTDEDFLTTMKDRIKNDVNLKDVGIRHKEVILNGNYKSDCSMMIQGRKYVFRNDSVVSQNDSTILYNVGYSTKHSVNFAFRYGSSISQYWFDYRNNKWELIAQSQGVEDRIAR